MSRLPAAVQQANALRGGGPLDPQSGIARELMQQRFSILKSDTSGLSPDGNNKFTFFTDKKSKHVTNIPRPGQLANGKMSFDAYALAIHVDVDSGDKEFDTDNGAIALGEYLRKIIQRGSVQLMKAQRTIGEFYGLFNFPAGGGPFIQSALAYGTTATTTTVNNAIANVVNGDPRADNMKWFKRPINFTADDNFSLEIEFDQTYAPPSGVKLWLMASLWGFETSDAAT